MEGVLTIGGEGVRGEEAVVTFAFEVVLFSVFEEVIETVFVMFVMGFFFAGLSVHLTAIRKGI